jgi:ribonuclease P protein subunit POP4
VGGLWVLPSHTITKHPRFNTNMNREERKQTLYYRHCSLPATDQGNQTREYNNTTPSLRLLNWLYEKNLTPTVHNLTSPFSFKNSLEERKHIANTRAIVSQFLQSSSSSSVPATKNTTTVTVAAASNIATICTKNTRNNSIQSFERVIAKSRLLRPAFCDVTDIWQNNTGKSSQLSLVWYERQREIGYSHLSAKKRQAKEFHKKRKAQKELSITIEKKRHNPKLLMKMDKSNKKVNIYAQKQQVADEGFNRLHEMWKEYISSLGTSLAPEQYLKIDLHGAKVSVVKSTCSSLVGKHGIIIKETCNMFQIWSDRNKVENIPKKNSVFQIEFNENKRMEIFGNHFMYRSAERVTKKFTRNDSIDL